MPASRRWLFRSTRERAHGQRVKAIDPFRRIADAFTATRLAAAGGRAYGTLPPGTQVADIIKGLGALTNTVNQRSGQVSQLIDSANTLSSTLAAKDQEGRPD